MNTLAINQFAWQKMNGLLPVVIQAVHSKQVLMLGYMDKDALEKTMLTKKITFFSRRTAALWVKGESSGNYLHVCDIVPDCDFDALLISVEPEGPTCHRGTPSCFDAPCKDKEVISFLEHTILTRQQENPQGSYVASLFAKGTARIAQKVGEEALEVALAAVTDSSTRLCEEAADLLFHLLILLREKDLAFEDVTAVLAKRAKRT